MRKTVIDGYIVMLSQSAGQEMTDEEYGAVLAAIANRPTVDGYDAKLRADTLEWELVELPPAPDPAEQEISADEAMSIITGGATDEA